MAAFLGYAIKYLGIAHVQNGLLDVRMHAAMIDKHDPLALIDGEQIAVEWNFGQESGLCTDAVDSFPKAVPQSKIKGFKIANILDIRARYYIRFSLQNSEEAVTKIKNMFQEKNIGIQQLHKKVQQPGAVGHLVIVTHEVNEKNIREVLKTIDGMEFITQMTKMIRIEE
jgi:homoserine dehydrogenase